MSGCLEMREKLMSREETSRTASAPRQVTCLIFIRWLKISMNCLAKKTQRSVHSPETIFYKLYFSNADYHVFQKLVYNFFKMKQIGYFQQA